MILDLGVLGLFDTNSRQEILFKFTKALSYIKSLCIIFSIYILFKRRIKTIWSGDISSIRGIRTVQTILIFMYNFLC